MPLISEFLEQIQRSEITIEIDTDYRGVSPGGTIILDLVRGHRHFATLFIRTIHPSIEQFNNIDSYFITEISIDNAEVFRIRTPTTAAELWHKLDTLLHDRHQRSKAALLRLPRSNQSNYHADRSPHSRQPEPSNQLHQSQSGYYQPQYSPRYKPKYRRRFPDRFYSSSAA